MTPAKQLAQDLERRLRAAADTAVSLARAQKFLIASTLETIAFLAEKSGYELPTIELHKWLGINRVYAGEFDEAMEHFGSALGTAKRLSAGDDPDSRAAAAYLDDIDIARSVRQLVAGVPGVVHRPRPGPVRIAFFVSTLSDRPSSAIALYLARELKLRGCEVSIVSSEFVDSSASRSPARARMLGIDVTLGRQSQSFRERMEALLEAFTVTPVDAVLHVVVPEDPLALAISNIEVAPVQAFINLGLEPRAGRFDVIFQTVNPTQERLTNWPGKSVFVGSVVPQADAIDRAEPLDRASLGIAEDAVVVSNFAGLDACSPAFSEVTARLLKSQARAILVLAGIGHGSAGSLIKQAMAASGVEPQTRLLGERDDVPSLLKMTDLYLDTFPTSDRQSLLEAMYAGLPVVVMAPSKTSGPFAPAEFDVAPSGDVETYLRIATAYITDRNRRSHDGRRLREHARTYGSIERIVDRIETSIRLALAKPAIHDDATAFAGRRE